MEKDIYLLYSCDEWKSWSSISLIMASTSQNKIRKEIKSRVRNGDMEYGAEFKNITESPLEDINNCLEYGYIDIVVDGEVR